MEKEIVIKRTEQEIKNSVINYLRCLPNVKVWVNNSFGSPTKNGGFHVSPNSLRGVSDILGLIAPAGRLLAIETKTTKALKEFPRKKLKYNSTEYWQDRFLSEVAAKGGITILTDNVDDVMEIIK